MAVVTSVDRRRTLPQWQRRCYSTRNENKLGNGKNKTKEMRPSI